MHTKYSLTNAVFKAQNIIPDGLKQGKMPKKLPYIIVDPDSKSSFVQFKAVLFQFEAPNQI